MLCFCLLIITPFIGTVSTPIRYYCPNTTYTDSSTYGQNLNSLLSDLSSNSRRENGFYNSSAGAHDGSGNTVYGLFMCRADVSTADCHTCVDEACGYIPLLCSKIKTVIAWYSNCMLRYSNSSIFGRADHSLFLTYYNTQNDSQPARFMDALGNTLNEMATRAAGSSRSGKKFATLEANYTANETIYSFGQCTPDLSDSDCQTCLGAAIGYLPMCCYSSLGARIYSPSCNIRSSALCCFKHVFRLQSSPSFSTNLIQCGVFHFVDADNGNSSWKVIVAIVIPAMGIILFISIFCFLRIKNFKKQTAKPQTTDVTGVSTEESLQYDFATIQAITNDFSLESKIGEGGYGSVYKGWLPTGQEVAIKRLSKSSGQGAQEFKNEVEVVAKLQHRNLAWEQWRNCWPLQILDSSLGESYTINEVVQCVHIGLLCVQEDADVRPTMADVMLMLTSYSAYNWAAPREPAFYRNGSEKALREKELQQSVTVNEMSISEPCPR
nr:cysteine-rich receptor-like protein kinase 10 [Ipomoea batatas]